MLTVVDQFTRTCLARVNLWFAVIGPNAHSELNARGQEIMNQEEYATWVFRGCFVIASLLLTGVWLKENQTVFKS